MGAYVKGTKPTVSAPDFNRFERGSKSKTIQNVKDEDEERQKRKADRVARAKEKYQIQNHFDPVEKKPKQNIRETPLREADDEIEAYMKAEGLL